MGHHWPLSHSTDNLPSLPTLTFHRQPSITGHSHIPQTTFHHCPLSHSTDNLPSLPTLTFHRQPSITAHSHVPQTTFHHLFTLPLHLTNLHILSRSLIAFLILSQSLISDCTRINYYKRKLN